MPSMFRSPNEVSSSAESQDDVTSEESHVSNKGEATALQAGLDTDGNQESNRQELRNGDSPGSGALAQIPSASPSSLPNLLPHQHQSLFHLTLLDDKCRLMAAKHLNSSREPQDYLNEDHPDVVYLGSQMYSTMSKDHVDLSGLSPELIGPEGASIRKIYSTAFDEILSKAAVTASRGLDSQSSSQGRAKNFPGFGLMSIDSTVAARSSAPAIMSGANRSPFKRESAYVNEYHEISQLGKGGYGQVFKVRNHLDKQEYAIKKIVISSRRVRRYLEKDQVDSLLAEVQTLARLNHRNIVRYLHSWVEYTTPATHVTSRTEFEDRTGGRLMITGPEYPENSSSQLEDNYSLSRVELEYTVGHEGNMGMVQEYETAVDHDEYDDGIVFEYSSPQNNRSAHERSVRNRRTSQATITSSMTHQTSVLSMQDDDDPEIETIPRVREEIGVIPSLANPAAANPGSSGLGISESFGPDITLYIKMTLHPMTLHSYLSPEVSGQDGHVSIRHCFHQEPSIAILGTILDGIEYLHSQRIVHRDIKPANIFLSVHEDTPPSSKGCVNILDCSECHYSDHDRRIYITPCLGDFGLIAEIKEPAAQNSESDPVAPRFFQPSSFAALQHKPVGTPFYRPIAMPQKEPIICPKLDVYSLGIISLEMIYKFGTKSERAIILDALKKGVVPKVFEGHPMADGIKSMCCEDRDSRWDCDTVRQWLEKMTVKGKHRQ